MDGIEKTDHLNESCWLVHLPKSPVTVTTPRVTWGSFQGHCGTKNGDHFGVRIVLGSIWGSFQGWDHYFSGRDHFRSCAAARLSISPELTNDQPMTELGSHASKQALSSRSRFREGKWTFVFISSIPHPQESDEGYVRGRLSLTSCANRCNLCDRTYIFQPIREILVGWQGDLW